MPTLPVKTVLVVLVLAVTRMSAKKPDPVPPSFVVRPSAAECRRPQDLGKLCNDGTGFCTLVEGTGGERRGPPMACIAPDCGNPGPAPANGAVDVSEGTRSPSVIRYTCNCGYALSGDAERTCQGDGTWSGTEPTCTYVPTTPSPSPCSNLLQFNTAYGLFPRPPYNNNGNLRGCFKSPPCTSITINITNFAFECDRGTADCPIPTDLTTCQHDWFEIIDDGTPVRRLCGTADNIVVSGLSHYVGIWIWTDNIGAFYGLDFYAYYE